MPIFNACELATYAQVKDFLIKNQYFKEENFSVFFISSFAAGLLTVIVGSPFRC